jgi:type II secretory pathway pseudopilin PulG
MASQQHLLVALAVILLVTNLLGFVFTVRRNRQRRTSEEMHAHSHSRPQMRESV